jgi:tetratricopeptide (TPR) repeat protein
MTVSLVLLSFVVGLSVLAQSNDMVESVSQRDRLPIPTIVSSRTLAHKPSKPARKEFDRGMEAWRRKQNTEAQHHFAEAARLDPDFVQALTALAVVHLKAHEPEPALEYLNRALALEPSWAMLHCNKASALMMLDHPEEAEQAARRALQLDPGWVDASYMLGLAMLTEGKETPEVAERLAAAAGTYPKARELLIKVQGDLAITRGH